MIQCQLKLRLSGVQGKLLIHWLWHLTGVYNWAIRKIELDAKDKIYPSKFDLFNLVSGHGCRVGVPSHVLQGTVKQAHQAWQRCFKKIAKKPHFKGNRRKLNSIPFPDPFKPIVGNHIFILGLGNVHFHKQNIPEGKIKCGRIVKRASGWYLCLFIDTERKPITRISKGMVGIDPGFKSLLTTSDGEIIGHPKELEAGALRLAQVQRGRNTKLVARLHERMANQRKDRNHKLSLRLVQENSFIAFSKDNLKGMSAKFGKSVASSSHYQLRQMLKYKSRIGGTEYVEVDSKFSTKTCSVCGTLSGPTGWSGLKVRQWCCTECGTLHDRDVNAARNTLIAGAGNGPRGMTHLRNGSSSENPSIFKTGEL